MENQQVPTMEDTVVEKSLAESIEAVEISDGSTKKKTKKEKKKAKKSNQTSGQSPIKPPEPKKSAAAIKRSAAAKKFFGIVKGKDTTDPEESRNYSSYAEKGFESPEQCPFRSVSWDKQVQGPICLKRVAM